MNDIIPPEVMKEFVANPNIGRLELAKRCDISESDARFYCKLFKEKQQSVKIIDIGIAAFDIHHPYHDKPSINCLIKAIKKVKPTIFIFGGDNMDMDTISTYNRKKPMLVENKRISNDYEDFNKDILQPIEQILSKDCKRIFMLGNHEERVKWLIESEPKLQGLIEIEKNLPLQNWKIVDYKEIVRIGHMYFTHGIYYNKYHAAKNVSAYQKNIFSGHAHTSQIYTAISPVNTLPKQGVSVGCLCNQNPEYKEDEPNTWVNQFLIFYIMSDGTFRYELPTIIFGRCIINGELIDGNE